MHLLQKAWLPFVAVATFSAGQAVAGLGDPVFYGGSTLTIVNDPTAGGAYLNPTYLESNSATPDLFLFNRGTDQVVSLAETVVGDLGYSSGDELVFYILSNDGQFFTGDASRNSDGFAHADVTGSPFSYFVSFEDQRDLGDRSFGNAKFSVQSGTPVPTPLSILGVASAFGSIRKFRQFSSDLKAFPKA